MTDHTQASNSDEIDVDPYADERGAVGSLFIDEVGEQVSDLLGHASMWEQPSSDLADRVALAVSSEAMTGPGERSSRVIGDVEPLSFARRTRPLLLGASAAVVLLFGGIVMLSALSGNPQQQDFAATFVSTGEILDVGGEVEVTALASGLRIDVDAPSLPRRSGGDFYQGWLQLDDGNLVPVGSFNEGSEVTLWAGADLDQVVAMTITLESASSGDSADQASSGQVVLKVDFP